MLCKIIRYNRGWVPQNVTKFLICQVGINTKLGGGSPNILLNPKGHVGIDTKLRGWVPPFLENVDFQVGINTNFGGGGVRSAQKVKSRVFGLWVGIINVDPPAFIIVMNCSIK